MFDYSKTIPRFEKQCADCGASFKTAREHETRCSECCCYHDHPECAPGYFTWTKTNAQWVAVARWRDRADPPVNGAVITVHRQDGSSSEHTIIEILDQRYDPSGNRLLRCRVSR